MIDLEMKFSSRENDIKNFIDDRINTYFRSKCFTFLKRRQQRLIDASNLRSQVMAGQATNEWKSKLTFPLVKERANLRAAVTKQNFRAEPLFTLDAMGDTSEDQASTAQDVLNLNIKNTRFRRDSFPRLIKMTADTGAGVTLSDFVEITKEVMRTVNTNVGPQRMLVPTIFMPIGYVCIVD